MRMWRYRRARLFQNLDRHISCNTGEIGEKLIKSVAGLKIVEQILDRYTGASKYWHATLHLRINGDYVSCHSGARRSDPHMIRRSTPFDGQRPKLTGAERTASAPGAKHPGRG